MYLCKVANDVQPPCHLDTLEYSLEPSDMMSLNLFTPCGMAGSAIKYPILLYRFRFCADGKHTGPYIQMALFVWMASILSLCVSSHHMMPSHFSNNHLFMYTQ